MTPLSASYYHRWEQLDATAEMSLVSPRSHHHRLTLSLSHGLLCSGYNHGDERGIEEAGKRQNMLPVASLYKAMS